MITTLKEIFDKLNEIALRQPSIGEVIRSGDIYDLNSERNTKFAVFALVNGSHSYDVENGITTYDFFMYFVDRTNNEESNRIQVQSTGMETLKNILKTLVKEEDVEINGCSFTLFLESFTQICAGCYASVQINVYDDGCGPEIF